MWGAISCCAGGADVVRTLVEMRLHDGAVDDEEIDVDRPGCEPARAARASDG